MVFELWIEVMFVLVCLVVSLCCNEVNGVLVKVYLYCLMKMEVVMLMMVNLVMIGLMVVMVILVF